MQIPQQHVALLASLKQRELKYFQNVVLPAWFGF